MSEGLHSAQARQKSERELHNKIQLYYDHAFGVQWLMMVMVVLEVSEAAIAARGWFTVLEIEVHFGVPQQRIGTCSVGWG